MSNSRNTGFLTNVIKVDATGNVSFVSGSTTLATISTSGQMSGSVPALSSSYALSASYVTNAETLDGLDSTVFTLTSSFNTTSASLYTVSSSAYATSGSLSATSGSLSATSGSFNTRVSALEITGSALSSSILSVSASSYLTSGSLSSASGSFNTRISTVESKYATTGSNTFTAPQYVTDTTVPVGFANSTGSIYTDGGLLVAKDSYFSGSMFIKGNLTIYGTQSVAYITSSQLNIATNVITVNTATPSVRFGGLNVYDSGSTGTGATGSLFWDSQNNGWVYQRESGSTYSGGMLISGPRRGSGTNLGDEQGTTACMVMVGQGGDHITSSLIYHDSSVTCIPGAIIGGTMSGTTIYGSTAVCSAVGKFTTCIDAGSVTATSFNLGNGQYLRLTRNSGALQYDAFGIVAGTDNTRIISTNDFDIVNGGLVSQFKIAGSGAATFACGVGICGSLDIIGNTTSQTFNTRSGTGFNSFQMGADTSAGGFYVYDNTNGVYRFTIKNSGIATFACQVCAPSAVFSKAADQVIRVETTSATDNSRIDFITPSKCYTIQNLQTGAANALIFYDLSASTERMRITSTGIACFSSRICAPALTTCNLRVSDETTFGLSICKGSSGYPIIQADLGQSIGFFNGESGGAYAERMRIFQNGIISIGCQVCLIQLTVSNAGGASYNIANYLNTNSTTNSQTYFFMGQSLTNGRSGFMDWVDNTDCSNGYVAFGVYGDNPASGTGAGLMIKRGACVGINNNNPLRHLHVGPGSDSPINPNNGVYISNNGTTALAIRDSTNDSEFTTQVQSSGTILGTLTNHDLIIYTCNAERGRICANGKTRFLACGFGSYIFGNPNVSDDGTFIIGSVVGGTPLSLTDGYNAHTYFRFCSGQSVIESDGTMKFMTAGSINSLILAGTTGIACFSTTNAMIPPVGTTAQRPTASTGMMRYNSTFNLMEFYNGTSWVQMGSGDLATAQCINNTSMCHSVYQASGTLGLQGQGSGCISLYGAAAPSMATSNTGNQFATHGGHCGASDYPGYWAVHLGGARAANQLKVWIHTNSWGYFELQGSNNSGNASGFNQSGNWTTLSFLCSNNSNCQNMGGNASGCTDGTVFSFWYTNDVPFAAYRIKVLDSSRQTQPLGTTYGGSAGYVWQLNRV